VWQGENKWPGRARRAKSQLGGEKKRKKNPRKGKGEKEKEKVVTKETDPWGGGQFHPIHGNPRTGYFGWCTGGCSVTEAAFSKQDQLQFPLADMKLSRYLLEDRQLFPNNFKSSRLDTFLDTIANFLFRNAWVQ
jgi:hypothetical protein